MKVGMTLPVTEPGWTREIFQAWVDRVERGPFASLAMGERIAFPSPEIVSLLAASAALTTRVRIVASVAVLPLHDAVHQAKQYATVDMLSGGRLVLGVGVGGRDEDYRALSEDPSRRRIAALEASVATLRRVWAGELPAPEVLRPVEPFPVQPGGPKILAGVMGPKGLASAARWAAGISGMLTSATAAEARSAFAAAEHAWREAGRSEAPIKNTATWFALGSADSAREQLRIHLARYFNWMPQPAREVMAERFGFAGSGEELRDLLRAVEDAGADEVLLIPTAIDPAEVDRVSDFVSEFR